MFTGYELTASTRNMLLERFPPKYKNVKAHHITLEYGISKDTSIPSEPTSVEVVGYIDSGDGVEGLLVSVNSSTERPDGSKYHITWSLDDGRKPVETNKYVNNAEPLSKKITIKVIPRNFWY